MAMKPIKLKDLLTQTKKPVTQQIEIMEDYVLSVKTVFEGAVKDVPEDKLNVSNHTISNGNSASTHHRSKTCKSSRKCSA